MKGFVHPRFLGSRVGQSVIPNPKSSFQTFSSKVYHILNIYIAPRRVFLSLKQKPNWFFPFIVLSIVAVLIEWFSFPYVLKLTIANLPSNATQQHIQEAAAHLYGQRLINAAFVPIKLLFGWSLFALVLYYVCLMFKPSEQTHFRHIFAIVIFAEMILMGGKILSFTIALAKGVDHVNTISELNNLFGLDLLFPGVTANLPLFTFVSSINIFSLWYLTVLTLGISVMSGFSKVKSGILATGVWLISLGFGAAVVQLVLEGMG